MSELKREFTRRSDRIEELVSRLENCGDIATRAVAKELLQAVLELHAAALERILESVRTIPAGDSAVKQFAKDALVSGVLSLHDLNPVALEERVQVALDGARPYLASHGGDVELASIEDGVVHVRLRGSCGSCSSSAETMKSAVENAVFDSAPEVAAVVADSMPMRKQPELVVLRAS
jgi:Fe-S cluster biogenesis protein NfuA